MHYIKTQIRVWDKAAKAHVWQTIEISIDGEALARALGPKAMTSKRGMSKAIHGAIKCTAPGPR